MKPSLQFLSLVSLGILLALAPVNANEGLAKISFSVAVGGSDTNPGTERQPFTTLEKARDAIRALNRAGGDFAGGAEVVVHGGVYPRKQTFTLTKEDSGKPGAPVTWRAAAHEKPVFFGGTVLKKDAFVPVTDPAVLGRVISGEARKSLLQCDLKAQGVFDTGELSRHGYGTPAGMRRPAPAVLYVGGKRMTLARWPNPDEHFPKMLWKEDNWRKGVVARGGIVDAGPKRKDPDYTARGGTFKYDFDRPRFWKSAEDIWLDGVFAWSWEWSYNRVARIDAEKKEITLRYGENSGLTKQYSGDFFFAENLLEEIDLPGEYYIDRTRGVLYLLPNEAFRAGEPVHLSSLVTAMVRIEGAEDIALRDMVFDTGRGNGIEVVRGSRVQIDHCEVLNFARTGLMLNGAENTVSACHIYRVGEGCVSVSGGDFMKLIPSKSRVRDCEFDHWGWYERVYTSALWLGGVGQEAVNNTIHHCPHGGILVNGNNHLIAFNDIHHVNQEFIDLGAIYINVGACPLERGWIIRNNAIHDISTTQDTPINTNGVYFDHGTQGGLVEGNVFYRIGCSTRRWSAAAVMNTTAIHSVVRNNIFVDCSVVMKSAEIASFTDYVATRYKDYRFAEYFAKFDLKHMPHLQTYPEMAPFLPGAPAPRPEQFWKRFEKNLIWNPNVKREPGDVVQVSRSKDADPAKTVNPLIAGNNWVAESDPGFVNADAGDFTLKPDAEVFRQIRHFNPIPFNSIGPREKPGVRE